MTELLRLGLFLLSLPAPIKAEAVNKTSTVAIPQHGAGKTTVSDSASVRSTSSIATTGTDKTSKHATCPNRTVNHITHTLPQQCLRTDRVAAATSPDTHDIRANVTTTTSVVVVEEAASILQDPGHDISTSTSIPSFSFEPATATETGRGPSSTSRGSAASSATETSTLTPEADLDSPFDGASFLSFEEWKQQNLAKAGQSPENLAQGRASGGERQRPGINNALDTLGEESEIDLDFGGFVQGPMREASGPARSEEHATDAQNSSPDEANAAALTSTHRSKDAGRTCKERTNYASFDCAATVLKSNPECKSASSVLVENKDSYMLNICSASNKFFIIELCNDILVDTIVLANYEFFSSIFRQFRVSVSDRYPVKIDKWKDLGTFEARSTREVQAFLIENPLIWARYLRIEFLSHYGNEYYCPVSLLRVHGTTMMEEFRHQEEAARGVTDDEPAIEAEATASSDAQEPYSSTDESMKPTVQSIPIATSKADDIPVACRSETFDTPTPASLQSDAVPLSPGGDNDSTELLVSLDLEPSQMTCATVPVQIVPSVKPRTFDAKDEWTTSDTATNGDASSSVVKLSSQGIAINTSATTPTAGNSGVPAISTNAESMPVQERTQHGTEASISSTMSNATDKLSKTEPTSSLLPKSSEGAINKPSEPSRHNATKAVNSQPPQPSTQESFYKSIHKRLQQLESNSTLSLQYIEEQSRILRDAFSKVEKRQITATSNFLTDINSTVMTELQGFRTAYDQIWQSTVIELEGQREQYQREMLALSSRLTLVADELVWQKRIGIVQSTLLLLCVALVLFARAGGGTLEVPLVQQMVHRSQVALKGGVGYRFESPPHSPAMSDSRSPVSLFRRKIWRSSNGEGKADSGNVTDATESRPESGDGAGAGAGSDMNFHRPTSSIPEDASDEEEGEDDYIEERGGLSELKGTQSGPATPSGTRDTAKRPPSWPNNDTGVAERASSPLRIEQQ